MFEREETAVVFDLKDATACKGSTITGDNPACITTAHQQWAYAAVFPMREAAREPLPGECIVVRVEATVGAGRIGVAVAQPDLREFICKEKTASPGDATFELTLLSPHPGSWLVVRNTAAGGIASHVQIHSIKAYLAPETDVLEHPEDGGFDVFDSPDALLINRARLEHLASLGLPLRDKSVIDVGCGVGHLSSFFAERGCRVVCVDGRPENLERLKEIYAGRETHVADVEVDSLAAIGQFDIAFCYGLLYHTENPIAALRNVASCCRELLLLETVISDHPNPILQIVDEPADNKNQAVSGLGCRPSPAFIATILTRVGFPFVYTTDTQPDFPDFNFKWKGDCAWQRDGHLLRRIFVASRIELQNPRLMRL